MFEPTATYPILLLVNFWHELAQIMATYEFLRWMSCKVAQIMTTYEFLRCGEVILSTVRSISNSTYLEWLQLYLPGMAPNFTYRYLEWLNYHTLMLKMVLFDQQPRRKLSDWGMEAHAYTSVIYLVKRRSYQAKRPLVFHGGGGGGVCGTHTLKDWDTNISLQEDLDIEQIYVQQGRCGGITMTKQ